MNPTPQKPRLPRLNLRTLIHTFDNPFFVMLQHWLRPRDPIVRLEIARRIPLPDLSGTEVDTRATRFVARFAKEASGLLGCIAMPFLLVVPFVPWLWRIPTLISTAPLIAREVEQRTWYSLRSTPYSTKEIVQALHAGGTYRILPIWTYITSIRVVVVLLLGTITVLLSWSPKDRLMLDVVDWMAYTASAIYFMVEPTLDVAIDGMVAMLGSTSVRNPLLGITFGVVLRLALWGGQLISLLILLPLVSLVPALDGNLPALVILGPAYSRAVGFSSEVAIVLIISVVLLRLGGLWALTALTTWRAASIQE